VGSLRTALHHADATVFVGREHPLAVVEAFLSPGSPHRFLLLHGPGGIGKSTLLREIGRRGAAAGFAVHLDDAAHLQIEGLHADGGPPPLVLMDEADELGAALPLVRQTMLDRLPDAARVVLAGRTPPEPDWWRGGLDTVVRDLPLGPLSGQEARALLQARGLVDPARQDELVAWAHGSPLALVVAATSDRAGVPAGPEAVLEERLASWLAGSAIEGVDAEVLEVAALTSPVDSRLLAAALPGRRLHRAMASLWALPMVTRTGHGAVLHPALATAVATRLRADSPTRRRELVRRIAMHLEERARLGDHRAVIQLSDLIEDPALITGIARRASRTHVADTLRPGDDTLLARACGLDGTEAWAPVSWFLEQHARYVTVVRRLNGTPAGLIGSAPMGALAADHSAYARALATALRDAGCEPDRTMAGPAILLEPPGDALTELLRVGYSTALTRCGLTDLRHCLMHYPDPDRRPHDFLAATDWQPVPLWAEGSTWLMDWGPSGAIGFALEQVLREQGYDEHPARSSLLALGSEEQLAAALDLAFADTPDDRLLRWVIELAHLRPGLAEREILAELYVSRATYFRLLRRARQRILALESR
jgi:hypothetical protein